MQLANGEAFEFIFQSTPFDAIKEPVQTQIGCHDINITITAVIKVLFAWRQRRKTLLRLRPFVILVLFERHSCFTAVIVLCKYLSPALNLISLEFQAEFTFSIHPSASSLSWHRIASHLSMFIAQAEISKPDKEESRIYHVNSQANARLGIHIWGDKDAEW